jgi:ABC-type molybdenum transport system ATPase subunit/photorepair protein PhrA
MQKAHALYQQWKVQNPMHVQIMNINCSGKGSLQKLLSIYTTEEQSMSINAGNKIGQQT